MGASEMLFLWDGENLLEELDGLLTQKSKYTDYPGFWGGLASMRHNGSSSFYIFDLQWSARVMVSINATVTDTRGYSAFGERIYSTGSTENLPWWVGLFGYQEQTLNYDYVRARTYDKALGRWTSRDPLFGSFARQDAVGRTVALPNFQSHIYGYVANNPVTHRDPSGELHVDPDSCGRAVGGFLSGCYPAQIPLSYVRRLENRVCALQGLLDTLASWKQVFACATRLAGFSSPHATPTTLRDCMRAYCSFTVHPGNRLTCTANHPACLSGCAFTSCIPATNTPTAIALCVDNFSCCKNGVLMHAPENCEDYGLPRVPGKEAMIILLHEMAHGCGGCPVKRPKRKPLWSEVWSHAVATCIAQKLP